MSHQKRSQSLESGVDEFAKINTELFIKFYQRQKEKKPVEGRCNPCSPQCITTRGGEVPTKVTPRNKRKTPLSGFTTKKGKMEILEAFRLLSHMTRLSRVSWKFLNLEKEGCILTPFFADINATKLLNEFVKP